MSDIPDITSIPDEIAPIKPSELIMPAGEALHNASITQKEVKLQYRDRIEEQEMVRAKYLAHIKREKEELKNDREFIKFKIRGLKEQHDELHEALHYAKQDYEALVKQADLSGKTSSARQIMEGLEKEIYDTRQQISELEGKL